MPRHQVSRAEIERDSCGGLAFDGVVRVMGVTRVVGSHLMVWCGSLA